MTKNTLNQIRPLKIPKVFRATAKFIAFFSDKWVTFYAAKLFISPIKHKLPKREVKMDQDSLQKSVHIPTIDKEVKIYEYGKCGRRVLLVHGWSGRGTQLYQLAFELVKHGYQTLSFDAPAHGKSPGRSTIMTDFIETVLELEKQYGTFEVAIGHSLGGMSLLNALKQGFAPKKMILIGSGDRVSDIMEGFIEKLGLKPKICVLLTSYLEKKFGRKMDDFDAYKSAAISKIPTLVIHDENDPEVAVRAGKHIYENLSNGTLLLTQGLGHRRILSDAKVMENIIYFIKR